MEQLLVSPVRTEDPSAANLFFIPAFTYTYSGGCGPQESRAALTGSRAHAGADAHVHPPAGNGGAGSEHLHLVIDYIRHAHPMWNRTGGLDHIIVSACHLGNTQRARMCSSSTGWPAPPSHPTPPHPQPHTIPKPQPPTVNLLAELDLFEGNYHCLLIMERGMLILHPDVLLSGGCRPAGSRS